MDSLVRTSLVLPLALMLGCPAGDDGTTDDGATPSTSESPTDTGATSDPSATSGMPTGGGSGSATTDPATSDSTGGGVPCGDSMCGEGEYCNWSDDQCGEGPSGMGTCMPIPKGCDASYQPVCGCDGQVYGNDCNAAGAGVDVAAAGGCEAPEDTFECGYRFCNLAIEYCQISVSDVGGLGDGYSCMQPAMPCEPLACDCLMMEPCFEFSCEPTADGGIEIVCPGG